MDKTRLYLAISSVIAVIGFIILIMVNDLSHSSVYRYMDDIGNQMDTEDYIQTLASSSLSYIVLGGVLLFVGLLAVCLVMLEKIKK